MVIDLALGLRGDRGIGFENLARSPCFCVEEFERRLAEPERQHQFLLARAHLHRCIDLVDLRLCQLFE
ncbi:hypothetical protein D3C83_256170 [compost metagenome]